MSLTKDFIRQIVNDEKKNQLILQYCELLTSINTGVNITSFNSSDELWDNILEAVLLANHIKSSKKIMDIGSGNGIPGIIVAIVLENSEVFLVEIKKKKCLILEHLKYKLGLSNLTIINKPVEDILDTYSVDTYISKAFTSLKNYYELLKKFVGYAKIISLKGSSLQIEKQELDNFVKVISSKLNNDNFVLKRDSYIVEINTK